MGVFLVAFLVATIVCQHFYAAAEPQNEVTNGTKPLTGIQWKEFWVFRLLLNLIGYGTIIVPGYLIIRYVRGTELIKQTGGGCLPSLVRSCVVGTEYQTVSLEEAGKSAETTSTAKERTVFPTWVKLCWCVFGLLGSYLVWGYLQERIMTQKYRAEEGLEGENFKNSLFLVFMNRILALLIGAVYIMCMHLPRHHAPLYKYSYSSFSNIMSSWCQYEALKFVSFPTQVLAKASKIIPVMLMGKVMSKKTYQWYEYITAVMISIGVCMFVLTSRDSVKDHGTITTLSGVVLLVLYLAFDAFTSNWQGELFTKYKMSSIQMMVGVNLFSVLFTGLSLIEQGGFFESVAFMGRQSKFIFDVVLLSICSATGQLFIFYTISQFGAVVFTIIMTTRQALAILLSCIVFLHPVTAVGILGVLVVFMAVFVRVYCNYRIKARARMAKAAPGVATAKI
ncbi:hypothetical protein NP493_72g04056 [Ridgeia piscesae]|uniref:Adenosine 3'-phospho 5'-phosphosulfate transporter 1 n=1 Tax=Ridgeia piscesae TaxID=27915 RepID=A0AAD9UID1_RIDPI|nr:hypothetical protein NP493_72g04056 [Ridgeia piscesae]